MAQAKQEIILSNQLKPEALVRLRFHFIQFDSNTFRFSTRHTVGLKSYLLELNLPHQPSLLVGPNISIGEIRLMTDQYELYLVDVEYFGGSVMAETYPKWLDETGRIMLHPRLEAEALKSDQPALVVKFFDD